MQLYLTLAASHLQATRSTAGAAANRRAAALKMSKYCSILNQVNFVAIAIETLGSWNVEGLNFIKELGRRITLLTLDPRETSYLLQQILVAVQRGNAAAFIGCFPKSACD